MRRRWRSMSKERHENDGHNHDTAAQVQSRTETAVELQGVCRQRPSVREVSRCGGEGEAWSASAVGLLLFPGAIRRPVPPPSAEAGRPPLPVVSSVRTETGALPCQTAISIVLLGMLVVVCII
uniref:Uncharacterized protein n=1 Tax=Oryza meridionalis TaxID=40149 RepID=A0A0E0CNS5_9ORYZ